MKNIIRAVFVILILTVVSSKSIQKFSSRKSSVKGKLDLTQQSELKQHALTETRTRVGKDNRDVELAQYANDIYDNCPSGNSLCQEDPTLSVRYAVLKKPADRKCFVIVRGTQNINNWVTDFNLPLVTNPYGKGKIHRGFLAVMQKIEGTPSYNTLMDDCFKANWYIGFTGHSLGGAVATLAALQFHNRHNTYDNYHLATFGSPRVGNYYFQQDFLAGLSRKGNRYESVKSDTTSWLGLVHTSPCGDKALPGDIIPRVPPMTPIGSWIASQMVTAAFWGGGGDAVKSFLGISADDDNSRTNGYRHVGYRYQISCDIATLISCHSMTNVYLPALKSNDASLIRDC